MNNARFPSSVLLLAVAAIHAEVRMLQQIAEHELNSGEIDRWSVAHNDAAALLHMACELQALHYSAFPTGFVEMVAA